MDPALALAQMLGPNVHSTLVSVHDTHAELLEAEREAVASAVPARRAEYSTGRRCARRLLAELGYADFALLAGPDRAPRWPAGVVGSIAHTRRLCAVAVAQEGAIRSIGIDLEDDGELESELWPQFLAARELRWLREQPGERSGRLARMLFCAKESVQKCQYPLSRSALEPREIEVELDLEAGSFRARLPARSPSHSRCEAELDGRIWAGAGALLTSVVLAPRLRTRA